MKKLIYLLVAGVLFTFTACVGETEACADDCAKECCVAAECADDCEKACCLGCKATEGEKKCIVLEDESMPCCTANHNVDIEYSEDHNHNHDHDDGHNH